MAMEKASVLFPPEIVDDIIEGVGYESALAKLSPESAVKFNGSTEFIFTLNNEMDYVGENPGGVSAEDEGVNLKSPGGATARTKVVRPYKFEYSARFSDEFLYASEEEQLDILKAFANGIKSKIARALDISASIGWNPRTAWNASTAPSGVTEWAGNNFAAGAIPVTVFATATETAGAALVRAITTVEGKGYGVNGIAMSSRYKQFFGEAVTDDGQSLYPEFRLGATPSELGGTPLAVSPLLYKINAVNTGIMAIVGDWSMFRWGIAKEIPIKVIEYGDPDGLGDLQRMNQVCLRAEVYMGWAIMDTEAFARIRAAS